MTLEELQEMIDEADRDGDGEVNEANVANHEPLVQPVGFLGMVKTWMSQEDRING